MLEFSLYVLDITMNSVRAGATEIAVELAEREGWLIFSVTDNGCGMTAEQVQNLRDPFFTTRKTRSVGLGVPFLRMLSEMTGGSVEIESRDEKTYPASHGTKISATFDTTHLDFIPLGDMSGTVVTLIQGSPDVNFIYKHSCDNGEVSLSCAKLKAVLGDEISLAEPEILEWIRGNLDEQYEEIKK